VYNYAKQQIYHTLDAGLQSKLHPSSFYIEHIRDMNTMHCITHTLPSSLSRFTCTYYNKIAAYET